MTAQKQEEKSPGSSQRIIGLADYYSPPQQVQAHAGHHRHDPQDDEGRQVAGAQGDDEPHRQALGRLLVARRPTGPQRGRQPGPPAYAGAALVGQALEREMRRRAAARDAAILAREGAADDLDELVAWMAGSFGPGD